MTHDTSLERYRDMLIDMDINNNSVQKLIKTDPIIDQIIQHNKSPGHLEKFNQPTSNLNRNPK